MDHLDGFLPHRFCGFFQVYFLCNRKHQHVILFAFALRHKRFKRLLDRRAGFLCCVKPVDKFIAFILKNFVFDFLAVQNPHCICFDFFFFCHYFLSGAPCSAYSSFLSCLISFFISIFFCFSRTTASPASSGFTESKRAMPRVLMCFKQ